MPKVKIPRKSTFVDMTAMVDMGFLLVTFFMLATKFRPDEPVQVVIPSSTYSTPLDKDVIIITVDKDGRVFLGMDNIDQKKELVQRVVKEAHKMSLTAEQINLFSLQASFGVAIKDIPAWLEMKPDEMKKQNGIPCDSTGGELFEWIYNARKVNGKARIAIKADGDAKFPAIKNIINVLANEKTNAFKFNLITSLEESRMK
ncbi:MAG: biopolymer transporter ExbD [Bacteroidetes bacterium]|nr:biopolymer transporter ExbD [Bacteroidota bacterium]